MTSLKIDFVVKKAIFPVAGLGTRFLPATKASPKEMLAVVDKPLIQYAVEEAYAAGIRQMIFVTGRNKRAIEDHFDTAYELEAELAATGKDELMRWCTRSSRTTWIVSMYASRGRWAWARDTLRRTPGPG
jgi:UTP-glucose-1-phosphate uridylyltransferase